MPGKHPQNPGSKLDGISLLPGDTYTGVPSRQPAYFHPIGFARGFCHNIITAGGYMLTPAGCHIACISPHIIQTYHAFCSNVFKDQITASNQTDLFLYRKNAFQRRMRNPVIFEEG